MCGRYVSATPPDQIAAYFGAEAPEALLDPSYNVAPTNDVYAVLSDGSTRHVDAFHWGLVPLWAKDAKIGSKMINARAETLAEKNAYKSAFKRRRCLIPADGFYEWRRIRTLRRRRRSSRTSSTVRTGSPTRSPGSGRSGGVRTRTRSRCGPARSSRRRPTRRWRPIHDRMPVILPPSAWDTWLDREIDDLELLGKLLVPAAPEVISMHTISTEVNNVRNEGAHLIEEAPPIDAEP